MAEMQQLKSTQICKLFKSLNIWQFQFVEKFLNEYTISVTVDLKDPLWSTLLAEIVSRFSTITCKQCIVSLLNRAGKAYKICKNQNSFVTDLLILNVPKLLFVPEDVGCQVEKAFSDMIQSFIQENGLQRIITEQAVVIVDAVKPGNHFHVLLLKAVQKEIVPTANIIDNAANNTMKDLIIRSSEHISKTFTASLQLSDTATFNWSFIALCCKCIQIGEKDLKKLANFSFAIEKLCIIYLTYCDKMMDVSQPLCKVPEGIKYSDIKEYFNWIIKMQGILKYWYELFEQQNYNFDDTITYADMLATIESLARSLNITNLVHKIEQIEELKIKYHELYIKLCTLIVKDAEGCTLEELMKIYGVQLSATIQSMLDSHVILPGRNVNSDEIQQLSQLTLEPHMNLKLRKSLTCKILEELQIQLAIFVSPISEQLDFLVYFHLHNCKLFSNYLKNKMATLSLQPPNEEEPIDNDQKVAIKPEDEMAKLSTALTHTEAFIVKVINGSAKFEDFLLAGMRPEILQAFSYEDDVDTMIEFFESKEACIGATNAKQAISSMLKLLDIVSKLPCVSQLCHQYQLHGCTDDPNFLVLQDIIKSLEKQDTRNNLTGEIADRYMAKLHKIFCCDNNSELQRCLVLFENVAGCTDVYHFIEAKGFFGQTGKFDFWNQLELVTTHLKDEDYCTVALKELASTYEYVTLFMDSKQDFVSLLRQVHKLISNRINLSVDFQKDMCQLEAVNSSITAIRFWFSRVTKNHQASFQEIEYKLAMEIEKRFDEVRTNLIAQSDKAEAANSLLREKFSELESVLNSSLKLAHCEVQNLMQHRERNLQIQIQKFEEKYHVLQSRLLDNEKHQKDIESQLQKSNRDIESKQIQTLNEQIQQQNDTLQLLQTQLDRTNNSIISLNSQVKALSPQWIVDPCEITIDTKQEIGRGAYGTVNVATFRGTKVAAKCLHKAIVSPYYVSTFAREMDMAGRCRHPNLLQFIGATKDSDFIILTEIMDTSLRAAMGNKLIKDDHVVSICLDVAQGLNYLHENNPPILHRDVSSANVLLNELPHNKWLAKLSDYGTANFILNTGTQNPGAVVYAAPEASDPNNQTPKMDVYSYGKLVFEICVNELPTQDVCKAVFPEAETLWSPLKRSLLPLILDCLKHKQEQRLSMRRIIELLQRL